MEKIIFTEQAFEQFYADPKASLLARLRKTKPAALTQVVLAYADESVGELTDVAIALDPAATETVFVLQQLRQSRPEIEIVVNEKRLPKLKQDVPESLLYGFRKLSVSKVVGLFFSPRASQHALAS